MHVHLIGVSGTGMGSLAALFREAGHDVSGSDASFDPPVGPALREAGVRCFEGYAPAHLEPRPGHRPDLVIVGNAIRKDNPEAVAAALRDLPRTSMSGALREHFMSGRKPLVVAGTHGKTTTAAMCAWVLRRADRDPGWFIGGLPKDLPSGAAIGSTRRKLLAARDATGHHPHGVEGSALVSKAPFVVEGDEYDAVYWHKQPKFLDYIGVGDDDVAIVTSVEHDHIDIYPDNTAYEAAFRAFVRAVPPGGLVVCDAKSARARAIVQEESRARIAFYALDGDDTGDVTPTWLGALAGTDVGGTAMFDLFAGGSSCGRFGLRVPGAHNARNAIATIAACAEGFGVAVSATRAPLATFQGVRRRQDLLGTPGGVRIYDDFAHHPTAVDETLRALKARHHEGALWAVFEPRSATACRSLHQAAYAQAFDAADRVILAPLGRTNIAPEERLDLERLARELGDKAQTAPSVDAIATRLVAEARAGDTIALLSNGAFGGLHARLLSALEKAPR